MIKLSFYSIFDEFDTWLQSITVIIKSIYSYTIQFISDSIYLTAEILKWNWFFPVRIESLIVNEIGEFWQFEILYHEFLEHFTVEYTKITVPYIMLEHSNCNLLEKSSLTDGKEKKLAVNFTIKSHWMLLNCSWSQHACVARAF